MKQEYLIEQLVPGMYVAEVVKQIGKLKIKTQGLVRSQTAISALAKQGVTAVLVDLSKSKIKQPSTPSKKTEKFNQEAAVKSVSFEQEINTASNLYQQAKGIQNTAFSHFKSGYTLDVEQHHALADNLIDSVFRNQDALACVTRMRDKDQYLMEHSINVAILMTIFAKHLGIDKNIIQSLTTGAMLLDLGMISLNDKILTKPSALTDAEIEKIKMHVPLGVNVLSKSKRLNQISLDLVATHHERLDGSGYPNQLSNEQLNQYSRMIAIVDSYDAITAQRSYQKAKTPINAYKELQKQAGTKLDTSLVAEFIKCMGLHPVGTLVQMKSNKLGIVIKSNKQNPLSPVVNIFYSVNNKSHIEPRIIDLASAKVTDEIERSVKPEDFKIDMLRFFKQVLLN
ncbi:MAG: HD-GYP domain-containing protein (c-di-GMP phosphodiesterase class II) [Psychrosphaera sp.]|jgi:HD-GYP domain-containing protein (c-di-GMP phosphodiesterase class II)